MKNLIILAVFVLSACATTVPVIPPYLEKGSAGTVLMSEVITHNTQVTTDSMTFIIEGKHPFVPKKEVTYYRVYPKRGTNPRIVIIGNKKYRIK